MFTKERFVVFLDIMGFKERVARNTHDSLYAELTIFNREVTDIIGTYNEIANIPERLEKEVSDTALKGADKDTNKIFLAQFSDSIVIFSSGNTKNDLKIISNVAKDIMKKAIEMENPIPLKGALAEGVITCVDSKSLFFGQALIDAYLLEENIQYYGIVVHHSAEQSVRKYANDSNVFVEQLVRLKSGKIKHYELAWYKDSPAAIKDSLNKVRLSVSDSPRKYIDNTEEIIED